MLSAQTKLNMECEYLKEQLKVSKKENGDLDEKIGQMQEDMIGLNDRLVVVTQSLEKETAQKTQISQNLARKTKEF